MGSRLSCLLGLMAVGCPLLLTGLVISVPNPYSLPIGASIATFIAGAVLMCGTLLGLVGSCVALICGD